MPIVNGLPRGKQYHILREKEIDAAKLNNQFVVFGASPTFKDDNFIVFLEYVEGTNFVVRDRNAVARTGTIPLVLDLSHAPVRFDGGIDISGAVVIAKGFYITRNDLEV